MPPRIDILPLPFGSHAKPKRGAKSFLSGKLAPTGTPGSPGNTRPFGAFVNTVDCCPKASENERPWVSSFGELYSYRNPSVSVTLRRALPRPVQRTLHCAAGYCSALRDIAGTRPVTPSG